MCPESRRPPRTVSHLRVPRGLEMKQGSRLVAWKNTVVRGAPSSWQKLLCSGGWDGISGKNLAERKQGEVWKQPCDSRKNQSDAEQPLLTHNRVIFPFFLLRFPFSILSSRHTGNKQETNAWEKESKLTQIPWSLWLLSLKEPSPPWTSAPDPPHSSLSPQCPLFLQITVEAPTRLPHSRLVSITAPHHLNQMFRLSGSLPNCELLEMGWDFTLRNKARAITLVKDILGLYLQVHGRERPPRVFLHSDCDSWICRLLVLWGV